MKIDFCGWRKIMKKRLSIILAVLLVVVSLCATLIGCTPSKPDAYMNKWKESKNKSFTIVTELDYVLKKVDKVEKEENGKKVYEYVHNNGNVIRDENGEPKKFAGRTTIEQTFIKNGDNYLYKVVQIINEKDKDGKDAKTDEIIPTGAYIFELNKEGLYNVYEYDLKWEANDEKKIYGEQGYWTAIQMEKAGLEREEMYNYILKTFEDVTEEIVATAEVFTEKFTKTKGKFNATDEKSNTYTYQVKSSKLLYTMTDKDGKVQDSMRYELNEKFTISSGAKEALNAYKETFDGQFVRKEDVKGKKVYYISVDGKEYKVNEKTIGYELLENVKENDTISVRLHKGFFGGLSITEVYGIKVA